MASQDEAAKQGVAVLQESAERVVAVLYTLAAALEHRLEYHRFFWRCRTLSQGLSRGAG